MELSKVKRVRIVCHGESESDTCGAVETSIEAIANRTSPFACPTCGRPMDKNNRLVDMAKAMDGLYLDDAGLSVQMLGD